MTRSLYYKLLLEIFYVENENKRSEVDIFILSDHFTALDV